MNITYFKRTLALTTSLWMICCCFISPSFADGDDESQTGDVESSQISTLRSGKHLLDTKTVDLGKVPEETDAEKKCEVLLVADTAAGALVHEKNIAVKMPVGGSAVQLMTALAALDYLSPDETIVVDGSLLRQAADAKRKFGLRDQSEVLVSDLIASMVFNGDVDSALVLSNAAVERAGAGTIGELMKNKADQLGIVDTDYSQCDGTGVDQIYTTAVDQCEVYMEALSNETLQTLMKSGIYQVASKNVPWLTGDEKETKKKRNTIANLNDGLPDRLINDVGAVVPENKMYDVRFSAAVSCNVKSPRKDETNRYNVIFVRTVDYRSDIVMLLWTKTDSSTIPIKLLYNLSDIFSRRTVVNIIPYIEVAASLLSIEKSGVSINGWSLTKNHIMYGRQMNHYDPAAKTQDDSQDFDLSKMVVLLKPEMDTMVTLEDGSRRVQAKVLINNSVEGTVQLETAPKATQTEVSQNSNTLYTEADVTEPEPTIMSEYGWIIIVGGVLILAVIVIVVGILIRNGMERW